MSHVSKPSILWGLIGMIVLVVIFNKWMSSQMEHPVAVSNVPVAEMTEPAAPPVTPVAPMPEPQPVQEEKTVLNNAQAPVEDTGPKIGEKVLEPIYEPPSNDVILVN